MLAGVCFEAPYRCDQYGSIGSESGGSALDVEEAFGTHVGAETGLGDEVVTHMDPDAVGNDRTIASSDVAEWAGVDESGSVLQGLHQVGLNGLH